ncbi:hypothetical protein VPH35_030444 [Triticum aestivum]
MEMRFSAPVGAVHECAGNDGNNVVHSGSCRGALWWSLCTGDAPVRLASPLGGRIAALQIAQYCNSFLLLIFSRKESGAVRLDVPLEFDLVPFQIILCSAT